MSEQYPRVTRASHPDTADVIVVGAGPAGSTAAYHLATAGLDVLLLEKTSFPREKVCGDGLTPRAVKALTTMGLPVRAEDGWLTNKGLRIIGGGGRIELDWPELSSFPGYGAVRTRTDFDQMLARHAQKAGVRLLENVTVTGAVTDERTGRVTGVTARENGGHAADGLGARERGQAARGRAARLHGPAGGRRGRQLVTAVGLDGPAQAG